MAYTVAKPAAVPFPDNQEGHYKRRIRDLTFTGSYAVGGETITPRDVGLRQINDVLGIVTEGAGATTALPLRWNRTTGKLQLYTSNGVAPASLAEKTAVAYAASTIGQLHFFGV